MSRLLEIESKEETMCNGDESSGSRYIKSVEGQVKLEIVSFVVGGCEGVLSSLQRTLIIHTPQQILQFE